MKRARFIVAAIVAVLSVVITATTFAQCPGGACGYTYGSYTYAQPYTYYNGCANGQCGGQVAYGVKNAVVTTASVVDRTVKKAAVTAVVTAKKAVEAPVKVAQPVARRTCYGGQCYSGCFGGQCGVQPCTNVEATPQPCQNVTVEPQPCAGVITCGYDEGCYGGGCAGASCGRIGIFGRLFGWR